jgi:hypothetical protein
MKERCRIPHPPSRLNRAQHCDAAVTQCGGSTPPVFAIACGSVCALLAKAAEPNGSCPSLLLKLEPTL